MQNARSGGTKPTANGRSRWRALGLMLATAALVAMAASCAHSQPDVQLQVVSLQSWSGPPCPASMTDCFEAKIKNVGSVQGSGHCEITYFAGLADVSSLKIDVKDLPPGHVYRKLVSRTANSVASTGGYECHPGVRNATP